jgi:D-alanyl-lipoteichoic acid acyltransferase DltB (MBOAT superfamily)
MSNYYAELYFFTEVIGAITLFRLAARRSPDGIRQLFLVLISLYFLSKLSTFRTFWLPMAVYLVAVLTVGQAIGAVQGRARSWLLGSACAVLIVTLVAYKYGYRIPGSGSFHDALIHLRGFQWIGLSYLTFKAVDYLLAIRANRGPVVPRPRHGLYGLAYLLFFPVYISGPIQRYQPYLKDQLEPWRLMTVLRFRDNVLRASVGVIKILLLGKWAYANSILTYDLHAGEPASLLALAVSCYFYYLYFYFDFSGYCDAAIAIADFLEVRVPENFNYPFLAKSPQDFWNRWHITLSQWLRDMVFFRSLRYTFKRFPNVPELPASMVSIFFTFVLMGAWHGDTLNWVFYGCYHGAALSMELAYRRIMETFFLNGYERLVQLPVYRMLCIAMTFNFVALGLMLTIPLESLYHVVPILQFGSR